jgi:hypothetical protein
MTAQAERWKELADTTIPALAGELQKSGLPSLDPHKPLGRPMGGAGDGDDEP